MTQKKPAPSTGFSLVEVLVATAILAIAIVALAQLFLLSFHKNAQASEGTKIAAAAQDKLEELLNLDYTSTALVNGADTVTFDTGRGRQTYDRTWTVATDAVDANTKTITVTVTGLETTPGKGYIGKRQEIIASSIMVGPLGGEIKKN